MKFVRNILITRRTLFSNKLRTALALSGITVGVSAVIIMVSIGQGAQSEVLRLIREMGTNLLVVSAEPTQAFGSSRFTKTEIVSLTRADSDAIISECASVIRVAPAQYKRLKVRYGRVSMQTKVLGTTPDFQQVRNASVIDGEFFTHDEEKAARRVAVLGAGVARELFGSFDAIGEIIRIETIPFEVIGVLKPRGITAEGSNEDDQILIPLSTALRRVFNVDHLSTIYLQASGRSAMYRAEEQVRRVLRERHQLVSRDRPDDFSIQNQLTTIEAEQDTSDSFTLLISAIAALSLLVGGIGILAIMWIAVGERKVEIGLRMAVGARQRDILVQFLIEALLQGFAGGAIGVAVGVLGALTIGLTTQWHTVVPLDYLALALGVSLTLGLVAGIYPARRASLLFPITALRSE